MGKNFVQRQKEAEYQLQLATRDAYVQFMSDLMQMTLNDPEVMGKDTFGRNRLQNIMDAMDKRFKMFHGALCKGDEQDYLQAKLDARLRDIYGDDLPAFPKRYPNVIVPR